MKLVGSGEQQARHYFYDASGTIIAGGTPQVILPVSPSRSMLFVQNLSLADMYMEVDSATATATITSGVVTNITIVNAGFNFTKPPVVEFLGGGSFGNSAYLGCGAPGAVSPSHPAKGHCVMTGSAGNLSVSSITIDDGGVGYARAPYVFIYNSDLDPYGCADPSLNSGRGIWLPAAGGSFYVNGTMCPTGSVALYGGTTSQRYTARFAS